MPAAAQATLKTLDGFLASVERRAFRIAELALGHREDALDAVQDAMTAFLGYRTKPAEEWPALFFSILRSRITDRHRRNAVRGRFLALFGFRDDEDGAEDPVASIPDPSTDPAREHLEERRWQDLGRAVRELPARQREAFLLRELQGLSVGETALAMGCSEGSVKTHLFRALGNLRNRLEDWQ